MAKCLQVLCMNVCISFLSVALLLAGVTAVVYAIVILATDINPEYRDLAVNSTFTEITYAFFFVCLVFTLIAAVGCFTHIKKNNTCMYIFFILLLTTCSVILMGSIMLTTVGKKSMKEAYEQEVKDSMVKYGKNGYEKLSNTWDQLQSQQQCCGFSSSIDWNKVDINGRRSVFPDSCCIYTFESCGQSAKTSQVFTDGCEEVITETIKSLINNIFVCSLGFALALIITMVFTLCIMCRSDSQPPPAPQREPTKVSIKKDKEKQKPTKTVENKMSAKEKIKGVFKKKDAS